MSGKKMLAALLMIVTAASLAGCSGAAATTGAATDVPVVVSNTAGTVVAEAAIEPARSSSLSFDVPGTVLEVLVQEGDAVTAGDLLARLSTDDLERALAQAELGLRQAQLRLEQLENPADEADVETAQAAIADAQAAYAEAVQNLRLTEDSVAVGDQVRAVRQARDEAYRVYQDLQAKFDRGERGVEQRHVDRAHDAYLDAEGAYQRAVQNAELQLLAARNAVAQARRAVEQVQRNLDELLEGADALDLKAAQLEIEAAGLGLEDAQAALEDAVLVAPFDGTVATLDIDVGDTATPGQPVMVLATLEQLQARTTDLTELDVVPVKVGQPAVVTVDALPGREFQGAVSEIALQPGDYRGDVVYAVTVDLNVAADSPLRWGMTALVEIQTESTDTD
jgi:HlyD family secretion protein